MPVVVFASDSTWRPTACVSLTYKSFLQTNVAADAAVVHCCLARAPSDVATGCRASSAEGVMEDGLSILSSPLAMWKQVSRCGPDRDRLVAPTACQTGQI